MSGRFHFYRRRRALPFLAVVGLVFINGATLAPFTVPAELAAAATSADDAAARMCPGRQCERGPFDCREPSVVAAPPPVVKNLRRQAPTRQDKDVTSARAGHPVDAPGPSFDVLHRVLAANAADLTRLCRLLL